METVAVGLVDELLKLEQLHQRGTLSREEFERAKLKLLESEQQPDAADRVTRSLEEANYQAELARIDREWEIERRKYLMTGRYGVTYMPTVGNSLLLIVVMGGFGVFWTFATFMMAAVFQRGPGGLFGAFASVFPLFGIVFIAIAVIQGFRGLAKSQQYQDAEAAYQRRRRAVRRSGDK